MGHYFQLVNIFCIWYDFSDCLYSITSSVLGLQVFLCKTIINTCECPKNYKRIDIKNIDWQQW